MVAIVVAVIATVGGIVAIASLSGGNDSGKDSKDNTAYNLVVTPDNIDEILAENETNKVAAGTYDVSMNSTWKFENARTASKNASVDNVASNRNTVNFVVTRNDTGAVIYESPYLPVGSSLANIKLNDESLAKGTYPCTVMYRLVDDDYNEISTVNISISVVIEND